MTELTSDMLPPLIWIRVLVLLVALVVEGLHGGFAPRHPAGFVRRGVRPRRADALRPPQLLSQPLRQLPGELRDAAAAPLQRVAPRRRHVPRVPEDPEEEAEEDHQRAREDEEVAVKAAVDAQVGEDADEEEHEAERVQHERGEEERHAAAEAPQQLHVGARRMMSAGSITCADTPRPSHLSAHARPPPPDARGDAKFPDLTLKSVRGGTNRIKAAFLLTFSFYSHF